jgi:hypothetical protein
VDAARSGNVIGAVSSGINVVLAAYAVGTSLGSRTSQAVSGTEVAEHPIADLRFGDGFTDSEISQIQAANRDGRLRAGLGDAFGSARLEDSITLVRNPNLDVPAQWSPGMGAHRIELRPDAFSHPGDFLATFGHELHHAFKYEHVTNGGLAYDLGTPAGRAAFEIPAIQFEQRYLFQGTTPGYRARTLEDLRVWQGRQ